MMKTIAHGDQVLVRRMSEYCLEKKRGIAVEEDGFFKDKLFGLVLSIGEKVKNISLGDIVCYQNDKQPVFKVDGVSVCLLYSSDIYLTLIETKREPQRLEYSFFGEE